MDDHLSLGFIYSDQMNRTLVRTTLGPKTPVADLACRDRVFALSSDFGVFESQRRINGRQLE